MGIKKRKNRTLPVLIGVFVVLGAAFFGVSSYKDYLVRKNKADEQAGIISMNRMEQIEKISLGSGSNQLSFERSGDQWIYTDEKDFPLDQSGVTAIADTASKLTADRKLEDHDDWKDYGLDEPDKEVTVTDQSGTVTTIMIGSGTDSLYYARIEGDEAVYVIEATLPDQIKTSIYDMAEHEQLPAISTDAIQKIELVKNGKTFDYEITGETDEDGTKTALQNGISGITIDRCVDFKPSQEKLEQYGLKDPALVLEVTWQNGDNPEKTVLKVGKTDASDSYYYTMLNDSLMVNLVSADLLSVFISAN